jgi:hypothetical protein
LFTCYLYIRENVFEMDSGGQWSHLGIWLEGIAQSDGSADAYEPVQKLRGDLLVQQEPGAFSARLPIVLPHAFAYNQADIG